MKCVIGENNSGKATLKITMDAGANVEYPNAWTSGIAHLVEHMIFQGTNDISHKELTRRMAMLGADMNAATWHDKVSFFVNVPAENILPAATLLRDMLLNRKFDQDLFDKEKLVVLEEERGTRDDIESNVVEDLDRFLCKGPLSQLIIGSEESIKSITLEEVHEFYKFYYQPSKMLFVITGPESIQFGEIQDLFDTKFQRFQKSKKEKNHYLKTKRRTMYDERIQQPRLFVCYRAFSKHSKQSLALNFLDKFFASDMDSRLFQSLRQKHGLCYGIGGYAALYGDLGWYIIATRTSVDNINKSIKLIDKEIKLLLKDGPTDEEMVRACNKFISELYGFIETSYGLNVLLSGQAFNNFPDLDEIIHDIKTMSIKKIKKVARTIFKNENKQIFICMPGEKK